ncbi:MAG: Uma2 family endonuclease [Chloroflexota bacterium]|nr:Uma2 family endonuclease [Chloroflexota bacterium]
MTTATRATVADLYRLPDGQKAELVNGGLVLMSPTGSIPGYGARQIVHELEIYSDQTQTGWPVQDNVGFLVNLPHRQSFSPDAAFYTGDIETMDFLEGAPVFAVEVRSKGDYGPAAEQAMALKRADYFAAGTLVVWDVDLLGSDVVRVYRATAPDSPTIYHRGDLAEAEPALPGWRMAVDQLFVKKRP